MANGDGEPISWIEAKIGRRWSITIALMLLIIILVVLKEKDLAFGIVGFLGMVIGYFFKAIEDQKKIV